MDPAGEAQQPRDAFHPQRHWHGVQVGEQVEILGDREILIQAEALRHIANHRMRRGGLGRHVVTEHDNAAFRGTQQTGNQAQQRGLAGGIGADQPCDDAALDR